MGSGHMKLIQLLRAEQAAAAASSPSFSPKSFSSSSTSDEDGYSTTSSWQTNDAGGGGGGGYASPASSPSRYSASSPPKSPWAHLPGLGGGETAAAVNTTGLIASLVKEEGHVYSVAAVGDILYTGTDSENVRVWRDRRELSAFRTGSGLVKAIVVAGDGRIFTGHQDGKVRVWRADADDPAVHRRVGSLPRLADYVISSVNPSSYVQTPRRRRRRRREVWLRHSDAVSSLSLDERAGILYSGSWDRTFKAWRVSDSRCLDSVHAHDDAVNAVAAAGFDAVVFTGSADGTVKVWRRCEEASTTSHVLEAVLRREESAVTAIAVAVEDRVVYVGSSDGDVTYWHWVDGEARYGGVLRGGHGMAVMCLAVAGNVVVSGSADRTLSVWRRDGDGEHARLAVLAGHTGPIKCVAVDEEDTSSDGERRFVVYSGSLDGSVKVWRVAADEPTNSPAAAADLTVEATIPRSSTSLVWKRANDQPPSPSPALAWAAAYRTSEMNSVAAA